MPPTPMTPEPRHAFYADPANQVPQGPPVRRESELSEPVPVRLPEDLLNVLRCSRRASSSQGVSAGTWLSWGPLS